MYALLARIASANCIISIIVLLGSTDQTDLKSWKEMYGNINMITILGRTRRMERRSADCRTSCTRRMLRRRCGRWASSGQETETKTLTETNQVGKRQRQIQRQRQKRRQRDRETKRWNCNCKKHVDFSGDSVWDQVSGNYNPSFQNERWRKQVFFLMSDDYIFSSTKRFPSDETCPVLESMYIFLSMSCS